MIFMHILPPKHCHVKKKSHREIHHGNILHFMLIFNLKMTVFFVFIYVFAKKKRKNYAIFFLEFWGEI